MGYTTEFTGEFKVTPPLKPEHAAYLKAFSETRRMTRDPEVTAQRLDPVRLAVNLPVGRDGCYFVGADGFMGQERHCESGVANYNEPPSTQPGLWCQWVPSDNGTAILWNGTEKFYRYVEWLRYIVDHFLTPWNYKIDGRVTWEGEDRNDRGVIIAVRSRVRTEREDT